MSVVRAGWMVGISQWEYKGNGERPPAKTIPLLYLLLGQELLESVSQSTPWSSYPWESQTWKWLADLIVPPLESRFWKESKRCLEACLESTWWIKSKPHMDPRSCQGAWAVQSWSGQFTPDGVPAFFGFGASWSSRAVSQGSLPEGSGHLSRWEGPGWGALWPAQNWRERLLLCVEHLDIIFSSY